MPDDAEILETVRLIRIIGRAVRTARDANAASLGLTSSHADALGFIRDNLGCTISDLMKHERTSHQAACGTVERMREAGLIEVRVADADARARTLWATDKGRRVHDRFLELGVEVNRGILDGLTDAETDDLRRMLTIIDANLRGRRPGASIPFCATI